MLHVFRNLTLTAMALFLLLSSGCSDRRNRITLNSKADLASSPTSSPNEQNNVVSCDLPFQATVQRFSVAGSSANSQVYTGETIFWNLQITSSCSNNHRYTFNGQSVNFQRQILISRSFQSPQTVNGISVEVLGIETNESITVRSLESFQVREREQDLTPDCTLSATSTADHSNVAQTNNGGLVFLPAQPVQVHVQSSGQVQNVNLESLQLIHSDGRIENVSLSTTSGQTFNLDFEAARFSENAQLVAEVSNALNPQLRSTCSTTLEFEVRQPTCTITANTTEVPVNSVVQLTLSSPHFIDGPKSVNGFFVGALPAIFAQTVGDLPEYHFQGSVEGPGGVGVCQTTIHAFNAPVVVSAAASASSIFYNQSTHISWDILYADRCDLTLGNQYMVENAGPTGSFTTPNLTSNTTYRLSCSGPGGNINRDIPIQVQDPIQFERRFAIHCGGVNNQSGDCHLNQSYNNIMGESFCSRQGPGFYFISYHTGAQTTPVVCNWDGGCDNSCTSSCRTVVREVTCGFDESR